MKQQIIVLSAVFLVAVTGCKRSESNPMTVEQIIQQARDQPMGKAIAPIISSLATHSIFLATDDTTHVEPTLVELGKFHFKTDVDNRGRTWAYAWTNQAELSRAFPQGTGVNELPFPEFFRRIDKDQQFAGIVLNAGPDTSCPIPRELFERVRNALGDGRHE